MPSLTNVYRGALLESTHEGSIAVVDSNGRLLAYAGEPNLTTYLRSAAKPFQALPLLQHGGMDEYDLSPEEIAITCASHGGEPMHVATAAALLRKGEFDESDLLCGTHIPYDDKAAAELRASGEAPSVLQNNCSGKHAGMLLATRLIDAPSAHYVDAEHPLQELMRQSVAEFAGLHPQQIPIGVDGCGVPAYYLSLHRAAFAYARLMATSRQSSGALMRNAEAAGAVVDAMTLNPHYVAGSWSLTTPLMDAFGGELLAKEGAEGFYAMAIAPALNDELSDRLNVALGDASIGIALKIHDGSMSRGRHPAVLRTLELLGLDVGSHPALARYRGWTLRNVSGAPVGEVRSEFDLEFV
jgi:L-asparaginase II